MQVLVCELVIHRDLFPPFCNSSKSFYFSIYIGKEKTKASRRIDESSIFHHARLDRPRRSRRSGERRFDHSIVYWSRKKAVNVRHLWRQSAVRIRLDFEDLFDDDELLCEQWLEKKSISGPERFACTWW